jgi:hypothetical protein
MSLQVWKNLALVFAFLFLRVNFCEVSRKTCAGTKETTNKPLDQDPQNPSKYKAVYINGLYAIVSASNQNV